MKVALFTRFPDDLEAPRGGVETVALALVRALAAMSDTEVHVVTLEPGRKKLDLAQQCGATIHRLPGSGWPQIMDILAGPGRRRLKRYLTDLNPDIVHFHETYGLGIGRMPMPYVFTVHGFDHANIPAEQRALAWLRGPLWKRVEQWGLARHQHIISITQYVRDHVRPLTEAAIYDIDNPINPACFEVPRAEVPGRVFFAGWITHRKNPLCLVQAFAKVIDAGVDASLHLAGEENDAAYSRRVREAIRELGLSERVEMLGRITPEQVRGELSQACVLVLPSRQENAPMAISESMAAGIPVISSNLCGMPFMVSEGKTGFLIDPEDPGMLAERLVRLLRDDALRERMGRTALESARERFHPDSVARKTRAVYETIITGRPAEDLPSPIQILTLRCGSVNESPSHDGATGGLPANATREDQLPVAANRDP